MKALIVIAAFAAAVFFFVLAVFGVNLADVRLVPAGLLSLAAGLLIERLPSDAQA